MNKNIYTFISYSIKFNFIHITIDDHQKWLEFSCCAGLYCQLAGFFSIFFFFLWMNARRRRSCNDHDCEIHSWSSPWFLVPVWCLCVAVISPRNKKKCLPTRLDSFYWLVLGPLYCVGCGGAALKFLLFDRFRGVLPRSRRCCRFCKAIALAFPAWQSVSQSVTQQTEQKSEAVEVCVCVGAQPQKLSIKLIIISAFNAKLLHAKCN